MLFGFFWGPIPWMIEAAALMAVAGQGLGRLSHHPGSAALQRRPRLLGGAPGLQRARRAQERLALQGQGPARRRLERDRGRARWCPATSCGMRLGDVVPADARLIAGDYLERRPGGTDRRVAAGRQKGRRRRSIPARSPSRARWWPWSPPPERTRSSAAPPHWCRCRRRLPLPSGRHAHRRLPHRRVAVVLAVDPGAVQLSRGDESILRLAEFVLILLVASVPGRHAGRPVGDHGAGRQAAGAAEGDRLPSRGHRGNGRHGRCSARTRPARSPRTS